MYKLVVWNQRELRLWRWKNPRVQWTGRCILWTAELPVLLYREQLLGGKETGGSRRLIHFPVIFNEASSSPLFHAFLFGAGSLVGMWLAFPGEQRGNYQRFCSVLPVLGCGRLLRFLPSFSFLVFSCCVCLRANTWVGERTDLCG